MSEAPALPGKSIDHMRCLVTGGAGFIGSHLVERLVDAGADVVVLDNLSTGARDNLRALLHRIEFVEGSVADLEVCKGAVKGCDCVLHQAAVTSVQRSVEYPGLTHDTNATGTLNMLIAARDAGVRRFIYASSSSVYGDTTELPKHEAMPPRPRSPYAVAKLAGELYCLAFWHTWGLETVSLRYFNVFGPRQSGSSRYAGVIPAFVAAGLRGEAPCVYGDGSQTRDFTYVDNVVHANLLAIACPRAAAGQVFNVGVGARTSVRDLWQLVRRITQSKARPVCRPMRLGDVVDSVASLEHAGQFLGYAPVVHLQEGLRRTVEHFGRLMESGAEVSRLVRRKSRGTNEVRPVDGRAVEG